MQHLFLASNSWKAFFPVELILMVIYLAFCQLFPWWEVTFYKYIRDLNQYTEDKGSPKENRDDLWQNIDSWGGTAHPEPVNFILSLFQCSTIA